MIKLAGIMNINGIKITSKNIAAKTAAICKIRNIASNPRKAVPKLGAIK